MRLFGKLLGIVEEYDRAEWQTPPFDLAWRSRVSTAENIRRAATATGGTVKRAATAASDTIRRSPTAASDKVRRA